MGCLLNGLRTSGISADKWTIAAQDKGEKRKTVEQEAERFVGKWTATEKARARLRYAVVCPNLTRRTKDRIVQISMPALVRSP